MILILMDIPDYYHILNLPNGASMVEIKSAYRKLALRYHPDRNFLTKDCERFKLITEAYQVLRSAEVDHIINSQRTYDKPFADTDLGPLSYLYNHNAGKFLKDGQYKYARCVERVFNEFIRAYRFLKYYVIISRNAAPAFIRSAIIAYLQIPSIVDFQVHPTLLKIRQLQMRLFPYWLFKPYF